ncbi:MAG: autotransporter outer membrane beta-barrel domain-containing protein [Alphaproteobacteria bacterium]|nr:autotransporter outer membrane beta-barrel domain-containing protein [Alphaproteobacteria bacterium]
MNFMGLTVESRRLLGVGLVADPSSDHSVISAKIGFIPPPDPDPDPPPVSPGMTPEIVEQVGVLPQAFVSALSAQALVTNRVLTLVSGPVYNDRDFRVDEYAWVNVSYGEGDVDGDSNAAGSSYDQASVTFGSDLYRSPSGLNKVGLFASLGQVDSDVDDFDRTDSELTSYVGGAYLGAYFTEALALDVVASAGFADLDTSRDTGSGVASGDTDGVLYSGAAKLSYTLDILDAYDVSVVPFGSVESHTLDLDGFTETGSGETGRFGSESETRVTSVLGVESAKRFRLEQVNGAALLRLGWLHQFQDKSASSSLTLASDPTMTLSPESPEVSRDAVRYGFGVDLSGDTRSFAGYADFEGTYNSDAHEYLATVGFSVKW